MGALSKVWNRIQRDTLAQLDEARRELDRREARIHELEEQAVMDPLTGLMNRRGLEDFMAQEQARLGRDASPGAMFVLIDLDRFKFINDTYGHQAGDACLQEISRRLRDEVRVLDCPARLGGDEFVVVLSQIPPAAAAAKLEDLRRVLDRMSVEWEGRTIDFGASVGGAMLAKDTHYEEAYKNADADLYANKEMRHAAADAKQAAVPAHTQAFTGLKGAFCEVSRRGGRAAPAVWSTRRIMTEKPLAPS